MIQDYDEEGKMLSSLQYSYLHALGINLVADLKVRVRVLSWLPGKPRNCSEITIKCPLTDSIKNSSHSQLVDLKLFLALVGFMLPLKLNIAQTILCIKPQFVIKIPLSFAKY